MDYPRSSALVPRLESLHDAGSTNDELVRRASGEDAASWPDLSVVVTTDQRAGRGRLGRVWTAPPGTSLAASILLRPAAVATGAITIPAVPAVGVCPPGPVVPSGTIASDAAGTLATASLGWIPLLAGLAVTRAIRGMGLSATLKWPNDVLIGGRKTCGILSELLPGADGVVVGIGLNVSIPADALPVDTATSLLIERDRVPLDATDTDTEGSPSADTIDPDAVLAAVLTELTSAYRRFLAADADPQRSGIRDDVVEICDTIGRAVRVQLPAGDTLEGIATGIDESGRLVVDTNGHGTAVAAGDVEHLRY